MIFNSSDMEIIFYFFIFLSRKKREQIKELKKEEEEAFPKQVGEGPGKKWRVGMQSEWSLVAAQFTTWWARKLALRLTWLTSQLDVGGIMDRTSEMKEAIRQYWVCSGFWRAKVTVRESPSKIKEESCNDKVSWTAKSAAEASP
jgi:hypothetical protein